MKETKKTIKTIKTIKKNGEKQNWYIISTYSGHEKKVANQIQQRTKANNLEDLIAEVIVPTTKKIIVAEGKKKTIDDKLFPGYVLVKMAMNEKTWQVIRNTDGVTSFVGTEKRPTPLTADEVKNIMAYMKLEQPSFQANFEVGNAVKIVTGPWKDFVGTISEINEDKGQVTVLLSVFGRETPVNLDFLQVTRLT